MACMAQAAHPAGPHRGLARRVAQPSMHPTTCTAPVPLPPWPHAPAASLFPFPRRLASRCADATAASATRARAPILASRQSSATTRSPRRDVHWKGFLPCPLACPPSPCHASSGCRHASQPRRAHPIHTLGVRAAQKPPTLATLL